MWLYLSSFRLGATPSFWPRSPVRELALPLSHTRWISRRTTSAAKPLTVSYGRCPGWVSGPARSTCAATSATLHGCGATWPSTTRCGYAAGTCSCSGTPCTTAAAMRSPPTRLPSAHWCMRGTAPGPCGLAPRRSGRRGGHLRRQADLGRSRPARLFDRAASLHGFGVGWHFLVCLVADDERDEQFADAVPVEVDRDGQPGTGFGQGFHGDVDGGGWVRRCPARPMSWVRRCG